MKNIFTSLCILGAFFVNSATADDASHRALAEELIKITKVDKIMDPMMGRVKSMMNQQFSKMGVGEDKRPVFNQYVDKMVKILETDLAWDKIKNNYVDIYTKVYTEAELKELTKFYKTPVGQKFIEKMPEIMQESMTVSQGYLQQVMPKIQSISKELDEELKKEGATQKSETEKKPEPAK